MVYDNDNAEYSRLHYSLWQSHGVVRKRGCFDLALRFTEVVRGCD